MINPRSAAAIIVAGGLGAIAGAIAASRLPSDKFAWTGFVLLPFFMVLELYLRHSAGLFGGDRNVARLALAGAVVAGFYGAWFAFRPV